MTRTVIQMDEEAVLITVTNGKDADGFPTETSSRETVFVRSKSATRTEFYDALRSGVHVKTVLEVRKEDFALAPNATRIEYDGNTYDIIRTYSPDKSMIELICG